MASATGGSATQGLFKRFCSLYVRVMSRIRHVPEQLSFPGLDPTARDRLFFAIVPDPSAGRVAERLARRLRSEFDLKGAPLDLNRLHVSLHGLGDFVDLPGDIVAKACEAAFELAETSFEIVFDRAGSFARRQRKFPLVLRAGGPMNPLIAFHRALGETMVRKGLGRRVSLHFTPHMTLLYDNRFVETRGIEPVQWRVREFVLVHSLLGKGKHIHLGRWQLQTVVKPA
jgi:2'-5' RNA ligase